MRHLTVKSNVVDLVSVLDKENNECESIKHPICPKPRRIQSTTHEFLKQHRCSNHSQPNTDGRSVILNLPIDKVESRESICVGCSPSCYPGSPPSRAENPLVHDVQFVQQMELLSPFTRSNLSDKFAIASISPI